MSLGEGGGGEVTEVILLERRWVVGVVVAVGSGGCGGWTIWAVRQTVP